MVIALITNLSNPCGGFASPGTALLWKAWLESRGRFFSALVLLASIVIYAVITGPEYIMRRHGLYPGRPYLYSAYIWGGLFHYALQGLWVVAAFVITLGGLRREKATGAALFSLGLPVTRLRLFLSRSALACAEAVVLGLVPALLIPIVSPFVGESYPFGQALAFGALMSAAGLVIVAIGLLLSEMFEEEFTAAAVGLCALTTIFLSYKAQTLRGWNVFDVMSATSYVDRTTSLLNGSAPWSGLTICLLVSFGLVFIASVTIRIRDL
jgi:ABC-type transport system involved in multi-copper enzyme maturation permease subunit